MSRTVQRHRYWLIPVCILLAGIVCLFGWQGLSAQTPGVDQMTGQATGGVAPAPPPPSATPMGAAPGTPGAGAPGAAPAVAEPTVAFRAVAPTGVKTANIKNWDGKITGFLSFKYKTMDKRGIKVYLPATYKTESMTRAAWDTLFQCYGMDREADIAQIEVQTPSISLSPEQMNVALTMLPSESGDGGAPSPASGAMAKARGSLSSIWASGQVLPPIF